MKGKRIIALLGAFLLTLPLSAVLGERNLASTLHALREDRNDIAIAAHIVVVGGLPEALIACVDKAIDRERPVAACSGTVNHQIRDIFGF